MARITYSGLIDQINGSIGGTTFQRNRYGFTIKRKPAGRKSGTQSQLIRRLAMYTVQQSWIGLSSANRANWNTYAATFPTPTRLNPNVFLNGVNLFEKYNLLSLASGASILLNPSGAQQTLSFDDVTLGLDGADFLLESTVTVDGGSWRMLLFLSRPVRESSSLSRSKNRLVFSFTTTGSVNENIASQYTSVFGFLPEADEILQFRRVYLNVANGQIFEESVRQLTVDQL